MIDGPHRTTAPSSRHRALLDGLVTGAPALADQAATRLLDAHPHLRTSPGSAAQLRWREDGAFHLDHLAAALATDRPQLFDDYVVWSHEQLRADGRDRDDLARHLRILVEVIGDALGEDAAATVAALVARALGAAAPSPSTAATHLDPRSPLRTLASTYLDALLARDQRRALTLVHEAANDGIEVADLYLEVFTPVLQEIGRLWHRGELSVGQEHLATTTTQLAMAQLHPRLVTSPRNGRVVVVAAVGGELHELGARMVADLFELEGWDSYLLGANTPNDAVLETVERTRADVLALSVTLPTHLPLAAELVARCRRRGGDVAILIGGRPFALVPDLWEQLGADGTAGDARHAVQRATELLGGP